MGTTRIKRTAKCTCGCAYGNYCGKTTTYLFCYNRTVDVFTLYKKEDSGNPESKYQMIASGCDETLNALINALCDDTSETITDEDLDPDYNNLKTQ